VPQIDGTIVGGGQRRTVAGVILMAVGAADFANVAVLEGCQKRALSVGTPGVYQDVADELGLDLEAE
jgi:hypothetical protein